MPTFEHFPLADIVKEGVTDDGCSPPPLSAFLPPDYADDVIGPEEEENSDDNDYYDYVQPTRRPLVFPSTLTATAGASTPRPLAPQTSPPRQPPPPPSWSAELLAPLPPVKAAPTSVPSGDGFLKPAGFPPGLFGAAFAGKDPFSQDFFQQQETGRQDSKKNMNAADGPIRFATTRFDDQGSTESSEELEEEEGGSSRYEPVPLNDSPSNSLLGNSNRKTNSGPYPFYTAESSRGEPIARVVQQAEPANVLPPPLPPPGNFPGAGLFRAAADSGKPLIKPPAGHKPGGLVSSHKPGPFESLMGPIRSIFSKSGSRAEPPRGSAPAAGHLQDKLKIPQELRRYIRHWGVFV